MLLILICWSVAGLIGYVTAKNLKQAETTEEAVEIVTTPDEDFTLECLSDAFRALAPNSRRATIGVSSMRLLQLAECIRRLEDGEEVDRDVALYLLSNIPGAETWAEKLRTGGGA